MKFYGTKVFLSGPIWGQTSGMYHLLGSHIPFTPRVACFGNDNSICRQV